MMLITMLMVEIMMLVILPMMVVLLYHSYSGGEIVMLKVMEIMTMILKRWW